MGSARCAVCICAIAAAVSVGASQSDADRDRVRAAIRRLEDVLPHASDRAAALYLLANAYTGLGDTARARDLASECLAQDEGFEPTDAAAVAAFRASHPPVHRAHVAFTVAQNDLIPEGIAYDSKARVFYLGSELHHNIVRTDSQGRFVTFVPAERDGLPPVGGLRVDPTDQTVWAATDSAEFVHIDRSGRLLGRFHTNDPGRHILNDLVVSQRHLVYVTDTAANVVFHVDPATGSFESLTFHRPLFAPNGITFEPGERRLLVADSLGVIAFDVSSGQSHDIEHGPQNTLAGIDGLYWYRGGLVGVQYGTGAHRVMHWQLSPDAARVRSSDVLEYRTPLVDFPTTGAVVGDTFYFIANTGIGNLQDGRIVDPAKLEPVHVGAVPLR
jgi:hypothetical protein